MSRNASASESCWFGFAARHGHNFHDEPATSCFLAKTVQVEERRNAYSGRRSFPRRRYFLSLRDAKQWVEQSRTKGSQWSIEELPSLAISGAKTSLIFTVDAEVAPSSRTPSRISSLEEFGEAIGEDSISCYVCPRHRISPAVLPFIRYDSWSSGGDHPLYWTPLASRRTFDWVLRMSSNINKAIQREALRHQ